MNLGDKVSLPFGKGTKDGVVVRIFDKSVWLKVDFPRHPGKLVRRKQSQLQASAGKSRRKKATSGK